MITAKVYRDQHDETGVVVQLMTTPRIGESISVPDSEGVECDLKVTDVNHWIKPIEGRLEQVELVIFTF